MSISQLLLNRRLLPNIDLAYSDALKKQRRHVQRKTLIALVRIAHDRAKGLLVAQSDDLLQIARVSVLENSRIKAKEFP